MFFDDRLATVLRHRAAGENAARTQYRQLLDLLGNRKYGRDESLIAAAWLRIGALSELIPSSERARMISEPGWRFRSPELAAHLAEDEPDVAAAALARARLEEEDWETLIPRLPVRARGFLRLRRDLPPGAVDLLDRLGVSDRGLPLPEEMRIPQDSAIPDDANGIADTPSITADAESEAIAPQVTPVVSALGERSEISALVERIAQFRRERESAEIESDIAPRLPLDDGIDREEQAITSFGFSTDAAGRIDWADSVAAPMVVGRRLLKPRELGAPAELDPIARAFHARQPIEALQVDLVGAPAVTGEWVIDAEPRFTRAGGRFLGFVGSFRRHLELDGLDPAAQEADRMRQLLHELRTPVNAVQGFAEVIQQQLFGPAPHEYRALAANIAGDAARILAGFEELERLAKLEGGLLSLDEGETDLASLARRMTGQLQPVLAPRMAGIETGQSYPDNAWALIAPDEAEAMLWRILATTAGIAGAGETLIIDLACDDETIQLHCDLPERLRREPDIFAAHVHPGTKGPSAGLFGAGFSLRLAAAEANAASGELVREDTRMRLSLPIAKRERGDQTQQASADKSEEREPARKIDRNVG